jgi:hypothetical protein
MTIAQRPDGWFDLAPTLDESLVSDVAAKGLSGWQGLLVMMMLLLALLLLAGLAWWLWRRYQAWYAQRRLQRLVQQVERLVKTVEAFEVSVQQNPSFSTELRRLALAIYQVQSQPSQPSQSLNPTEHRWLYEACFSDRAMQPQAFYQQLQQAMISFERDRVAPRDHQGHQDSRGRHD